jgi:A/G-specific adenine glycosylase
MTSGEASRILSQWYLKNKRQLPWRQHRDPYLIWISEVMLQQTTVQAVIPYYQRFIQKFPNVKALAHAPIEDVIEMWAGLGYYSRARNLHRAAQAISKLNAFPQSYRDLIELPGFGDYTARAVSSIAFDEPAGVVDGNVIRILSRLYGQPFQWWKSADKKTLQDLSDQLAMELTPSIVNQGMMELGATICTPTNPACTLCPWLKLCKARKQNIIEQLPARKPKKAGVMLLLDMELIFYKEQLALIENADLPILKKTLLPPIKYRQISKKPVKFDFQHSITHHQIYVRISTKVLRAPNKNLKWYPISEIAKINPSSLIKKALSSIK